MAAPSLDRLIRKEVALGTIRDIQPPQNHVGLAMIAPFLDVATDDVIFDYIRGGVQEGLAPARAEDAEAELRSEGHPVLRPGARCADRLVPQGQVHAL